jgi:hypothetical protein
MLRSALAPLVAICIAVTGCTGERLPPPPEGENLELAQIPGVPPALEIRFWGDLAPASAEEQLRVIRAQIAERISAEGAPPNGGRYDVLALSGGGSDGAYGAGLLAGWSDREGWEGGQARPEFGLVTGISVGALIAPFAFLGPEYDDELERLFTTTSTADLLEFNIVRALFGYSMGLTDVQPLEATFNEIMTPQMIARIADEHRKGRRLWIGTTYLDAERPVIWDIGAIAASEIPRKRELIRKIMMASAAIPGAFPPVMFPVEVEGETYAEMHVDGSVTRQVFVYPSNVDLTQQLQGTVPGMQLGTIYLVRNSKLAPDYQPVDPSVLEIVERSLFTLTKALALGDADTVQQQAERDGWRLLRTSVPLEFEAPEGDFFDPRYMTELFEVGYRRAVNGIAWEIVHDPERPKNPALALSN